MKTHILIHPADSVVLALQPLAKGTSLEVGGRTLVLQEDIDKGGKIALFAINVRDPIIKYGSPIGEAIAPIGAGELVHTHNLKTLLKDGLSYEYAPEFPHVQVSLPEVNIQAYPRANGDIGIRNELWVIPTVGCVNAIARQIIERFKAEVGTEGIDGVYLFTHPYGCSQLGDDHENTRRILADMVHHPNAGGALVIGLGCENNQVDAFRELVGDVDAQRVHYMIAQQENDEVEAGLSHLKDIYRTMKNDRREAVSIGKLRVGLECGGSDGLSGVTANPLLGKFSDYLISFGGSSVLTEVPEMFGAEHILFSRCRDRDTFEQAVKMVNDFKRYFIDHRQPIYENPSPGNKKGGISTLEDKSLGCTQKAGDSPVVDILNYGDRLKKPGLSLLSAPGNDAVATSALAAAGCHMVLFSTGRGTPYGGFVPTVKIATNSDLAQRKPHWIDFDAGQLVYDKTMEDTLAEFVELIRQIASGERLARNEKNDFRELAIFKSGVTL
ncbi:altronate hydrolase [Leminorella grimontii]|uniref:Altronate hydrolase n=1 Tax=Leminorella grimontii TaxID=82981 RepID=A0AAV5N6Q8_9GAMM|nr:altronate dehydratase family protein [Leminorella grimontii]KFC94669.1 altronate hydrolase [Leminorella grimontii ATCC 33999 = DSM 5078]GKX56412.1 altronate hydrolase [Leminorella grimontii]VFS61249.1 D-galactarate dehydratase [Leminorella grimontii]